MSTGNKQGRTGGTWHEIQNGQKITGEKSRKVNITPRLFFILKILEDSFRSGSDVATLFFLVWFAFTRHFNQMDQILVNNVTWQKCSPIGQNLEGGNTHLPPVYPPETTPYSYSLGVSVFTLAFMWNKCYTRGHPGSSRWSSSRWLRFLHFMRRERDGTWEKGEPSQE